MLVSLILFVGSVWAILFLAIGLPWICGSGCTISLGTELWADRRLTLGCCQLQDNEGEQKSVTSLTQAHQFIAVLRSTSKSCTPYAVQVKGVGSHEGVLPSIIAQVRPPRPCKLQPDYFKDISFHNLTTLLLILIVFVGNFYSRLFPPFCLFSLSYLFPKYRSTRHSNLQDLQTLEAIGIKQRKVWYFCASISEDPPTLIFRVGLVIGEYRDSRFLQNFGTRL